MVWALLLDRKRKAGVNRGGYSYPTMGKGPPGR